MYGAAEEDGWRVGGKEMRDGVLCWCRKIIAWNCIKGDE